MLRRREDSKPECCLHCGCAFQRVVTGIVGIFLLVCAACGFVELHEPPTIYSTTPQVTITPPVSGAPSRGTPSVSAPGVGNATGHV